MSLIEKVINFRYIEGFGAYREEYIVRVEKSKYNNYHSRDD